MKGWFWWTAASCQIWVSQTVCVYDVKGGHQSFSPISVCWQCIVSNGHGGWFQPKVHYHLHCLGCITLQVVVTAPGHQDLNLFPIGRLISTSDASNEGGVICNLKEFDWLMIGRATVCAQEEEQRRKYCISAWGEPVLMHWKTKTWLPVSHVASCQTWSQ